MVGVAELGGRVAHDGGERVDAVGAGLEERLRRDPPRSPGRELVHMVGAHVVGNLHRSRAWCHRREALTGSRAAAQEHLVGTGIAAVDHELGHQRMRDEAPVDRDRVVRMRAAEAGPPVHHRGAHGRAERPRSERHRRRELGRFEPTEPAQRVDDDVGLETLLGGVGDVLPLARAATALELGTRRLEAIGRRFEHLDDARHRVALALAEHLGPHVLARQRAGDEHDAAVAVAGDRVSTRNHRGRSHLDERRGGHGRLVRIQAIAPQDDRRAQAGSAFRNEAASGAATRPPTPPPTTSTANAMSPR